MADIMRMGQNPAYLGSWDLDELPNREVILTIDMIRDEEVNNDGRKELCTVIHWTDKLYKPMIANITNKKTLCRLYKTKDTEKLCGRSVFIGVEKVRAFGDIHDALRIRPRVPTVQTAELPRCEQCGAAITDFGKMAAVDVAKYRKNKYGRALCNSCAKAVAEQEAGV